MCGLVASKYIKVVTLGNTTRTHLAPLVSAVIVFDSNTIDLNAVDKSERENIRVMVHMRTYALRKHQL